MNAQQLDCTEQRRPGRIAVMTLSGELDILTARELDDRLGSLMAAGYHRIVLDMARLSFCDASGIGALIRARKNVGRRRGWLRLAGVNPRLHTILTILALLGVFPEFDDVSSAVRAGISPGSSSVPTADIGHASTASTETTPSVSKYLVAPESD
ncbi:STAS domain-containing protein [Actinospica robiniae]|uniref:STAS domain-containing protein n=1 Tax=Actinospica robiniae TaxID=304901 RepID=UPI00146FBA92|nr:STAS domain-containing protein [Actinospica robiniae]